MSQKAMAFKFPVQHFDRKRSHRQRAEDQARQQARRAVGRGVLPPCPAEEVA